MHQFPTRYHIRLILRWWLFAVVGGLLIVAGVSIIVWIVILIFKLFS